MVVFEHDVLGLESPIRLVVVQFVCKRERDDTLYHDLTKYGLPVTGCGECIVLGDESFDVEPFEVYKMAEDQRDHMNQIKRERDPHQYLHMVPLLVALRVLDHVIVILLIRDHLQTQPRQRKVERDKVSDSNLMEKGRALSNIFGHHF